MSCLLFLCGVLCGEEKRQAVLDVISLWGMVSTNVVCVVHTIGRTSARLRQCVLRAPRRAGHSDEKNPWPHKGRASRRTLCFKDPHVPIGMLTIFHNLWCWVVCSSIMGGPMHAASTCICMHEENHDFKHESNKFIIICNQDDGNEWKIQFLKLWKITARATVRFVLSGAREGVREFANATHVHLARWIIIFCNSWKQQSTTHSEKWKH